MPDTPRPFSPIPADESFDLRKWIGKIIFNWYWFALSLLIFGGGAYMITKYTERIYRVQAKIMVNQPQNAAQNFVLQDFGIIQPTNRITDEIQLLKSWTLNRRVLDNVNFNISYRAIGRFTDRHLYDNIPFRVTVGLDKELMTGIPVTIKILDESTYEAEIEAGGESITMAGRFNEAFNYKNFSFILSPNPNFNINRIPRLDRTGKYQFMVNNLDGMAYSLVSKLDVSQADANGSVLVLTSTGANPRQEVDFLNALIREYIQSSLDLKNQTARNTIRFIDDQLTGVTDTLRIAERVLRDFRSENKLIDISSEGQAMMDQLRGLSQEKALVDMKVTYYEYLLDYLENNENYATVMAPGTMGISDPTLTTLIAKLVDLSNQKTSLEYSAKENFPAINKIKLEITANQEILVETVKNILNTVKTNQLDVDRRISRANQDIADLPETERQLLNIQRRFQFQEQIYTYLMQRRTEAGIAQASNLPDQRVIDEARTDSAARISPKSSRNYSTGILLGLIIPLIILILMDFMKVTIEEKSDVEKHTTAPIIGVIGHNKYATVLPAIEYPRSSIAESFRAVRTNLQFSLYGEGKQVIMITSATAGKVSLSWRTTWEGFSLPPRNRWWWWA